MCSLSSDAWAGGFWCFSRVTVCWVDRFGLLIAVWWFWYVGCVEQVKSFMQRRLQIAFSCPSLPSITQVVRLMFVWINRQSPSFYTCPILLFTKNSPSFIALALYNILPAQNKRYNYDPLRSLLQANYSVITVRISYAPSLSLFHFLSLSLFVFSSFKVV